MSPALVADCDQIGDATRARSRLICIYCLAATEPSACGHIWSIWALVVPGPDGPWCSLVWLACADGLASGSVGLASAPGGTLFRRRGGHKGTSRRSRCVHSHGASGQAGPVACEPGRRSCAL